jgi:hypothetical protein
MRNRTDRMCPAAARGVARTRLTAKKRSELVADALRIDSVLLSGREGGR